jgi:hypothetical protein
MSPKKLLFAGLLVVMAAALWYLGRSEHSQEPNATSGADTGAEKTALSPEPPPLVVGAEAKPPAARAEKSEKPEEMPKQGEPALWEVKIDEALRSNAEPATIAKVLLQQVPSMPGPGQLESARHIANLIADQDYLSVMPYVRNVQLDPGFQEVIVAESLNRPDAVKLPVLLAAARTPKHPMAETAKSTLSFLLDANFGEDWGKWEAAVKEALQKSQ